MKLEDVRVGQKVKAISNVPTGRVGVVVSITSQDGIEADFPAWDGGHDGSSNDGLTVSRWYVEADWIELVEDSPTQKTAKSLLPADAKERKNVPIASGVLDYFPAALAEIAKVSKAGNDQHNPGQPLRWARGKSGDQADTMLRHFLERGTLDSDGIRHSAKMCWRALAILQLELEAEGAPTARGAKLPEEKS